MMRIQAPQPLCTRPTVSVVVPCYNYGCYLPAAVSSAFDGNEDVDVEVIVVDDCSTDGSLEVARSLARADARVRVVEHGVNQGHIRTYNDGLAQIRGDYVVLLSADDLLTPGSLARSAALMEHCPQVGLVYGYPVSFSGEPAPSSGNATTWSIWSGEEWLRRVCRRGRNIIVNPEAMLRRSLMDELEGYDADHPHAADMKLWMRAANRAAVGRVNGVAQAQYREHGGNMHLTTFAGVVTDLRESRRVFETFFEEDLQPGLVTSDAESARRALAREALLLADLALATDGSDGADSATELAELAADCWPGVRGTRAWRVHQRRRRGLLPGEGGALRVAHSLRWKIRWRRWRRFGT